MHMTTIYHFHATVREVATHCKWFESLDGKPPLFHAEYSPYRGICVTGPGLHETDAGRVFPGDSNMHYLSLDEERG
jgi:hypothetical protein